MTKLQRSPLLQRSGVQEFQEVKAGESTEGSVVSKKESWESAQQEQEKRPKQEPGLSTEVKGLFSLLWNHAALPLSQLL